MHLLEIDKPLVHVDVDEPYFGPVTQIDAFVAMEQSSFHGWMKDAHPGSFVGGARTDGVKLVSGPWREQHGCSRLAHWLRKHARERRIQTTMVSAGNIWTLCLVRVSEPSEGNQNKTHAVDNRQGRCYRLPEGRVLHMNSESAFSLLSVLLPDLGGS